MEQSKQRTNSPQKKIWSKGWSYESWPPFDQSKIRSKVGQGFGGNCLFQLKNRENGGMTDPLIGIGFFDLLMTSQFADHPMTTQHMTSVWPPPWAYDIGMTRSEQNFCVCAGSKIIRCRFFIIFIYITTFLCSTCYYWPHDNYFTYYIVRFYSYHNTATRYIPYAGVLLCLIPPTCQVDKRNHSV